MVHFVVVGVSHKEGKDVAKSDGRAEWPLSHRPGGEVDDVDASQTKIGHANNPERILDNMQNY